AATNDKVFYLSRRRWRRCNETSLSKRSSPWARARPMPDGGFRFLARCYGPAALHSSGVSARTWETKRETVATATKKLFRITKLRRELRPPQGPLLRRRLGQCVGYRCGR